jgi:hypothetical protein
MENKTCPTHKLSLVFKPEGVSAKSGNAYNAFWGCPNRACKYTENISPQQGRKMSWEFQFKQDKKYAYAHAEKMAVEMATATNQGEIKELIVSWRDWFLSEWEKWYIKEIINEE